MVLTVDRLKSYGFSDRVIDIWKQSGINELLPLQEQAVSHTGLLRDQSLIVFAPTSSGKTFIAELAAIRELEASRRVIYLVPTKALAEERYRRFKKLYRPLGFKVLAATRERPETDIPALRGHFDILVAVYEKMKSYMVQRPALLSRVGLIVADEVQMMGEARRGWVVDLLLTKVIHSPYGVRFLGLSAVLGDALRISRWLGCDLLKENSRPVDLREGVFNAADGCFYYRSFNSGERGKEIFLPEPQSLFFEEEGFYAEAVLTLCRYLSVESGEQILVFVPTRLMSRTWAEKIASEIDLPPADEASEELLKYEETHARSLLLRCFEKGVAFHNSDLSTSLRRLIEGEYNSGRIRILISTSTLGEGVNLTGKNVIQAPEMVKLDSWTGKYDFVPLSRARFRNQGGRAGRLGFGNEFGRSILIAFETDQVERIMKEYVYGDLEPIKAPISSENIAPLVLDLFSSGICGNNSDPSSFFMKTYTGMLEWEHNEQEFKIYLKNVIDSCLSKNFLAFSLDGDITVTGIGAVTATSGIMLESASLFARWINELGGDIPDPFETLLVAAYTKDAAQFPMSVRKSEKYFINFPESVRERIGKERIEALPLLKEILKGTGGFRDSDFSAFKKALLLEEWIGSCDTISIEERFGVLSGTISKLAEHFSWLIIACSGIAETLGCGRNMLTFFSNLAKRLRSGLELEWVELADLRIPGLERSHIQSLAREGYDSIKALRDLDHERIRTLLPGTVAELLIEEISDQNIDSTESQDSPDDITDTKNPLDFLEERNPDEENDLPFLIINLSEPGIVICQGERLHVTPLPYNLLLCLAKKTGRMVTYIDIDQEVWPDLKVERQQVSFHKSTLVKILSKAVGKKKAASLIKTYTGQGLILQLTPEDIRFKK
jgi:ATP-dependent DNA helicase